MSSPRVRSRDTPAARKNLDEFDLTAFNDRPTVRALLLPESRSAEHSVRLAENEAKTAHVAPYEPLPSPSNSGSEDECSIPRAASGPKTSGNNARAREARNGSQRIIILEQSRFDEKFKFVSSSDIGGLATGNDVVLKHPNSENQDICYINLVHLEVYPDPDRDGLVLCNRSTSGFIAHSLLIPQTNKIKPGHKATLQGGTWRLTLGKGLTFQIKVLPHTPSELYHGCLRLSPRGSASCKKPSESSASAVSAKAASKGKTPTVTTSKMDISKEKDYKTKHTGERAVMKLALEERLQSDTHSESSSEPPVIIGKTAFTKVFKTIRNNTAFAVKVCRKDDPERSAEMWRNELNMLTHLDHVGQPLELRLTELTIRQSSVVRLLGHNALILSLELEYIGPDLSQLVDEKQMSQFSKDERYRIWIDVARGMEHIHTQRIVHRDIKPQNILFDRGGRGAVICDFGISAKVHKKPEIYDGGTPCYKPPEFLFNSPAGYDSDIWAFGVTMLFVFRLIPLPHGEWMIAAVNQNINVRRKMIDWLHDIRQVVKVLPDALLPLRAMLAEDPKERITAASLAEDTLLQPLHRTLLT
ncbi:MAG: hypothetical protein Q9217_006215 [Psora testacea]